MVPLETCTREEQCSVIPLLSSEGVKPIEIHRRMKTQFGDACLFLQQMYEWDRKFKNVCQVYLMLNAQVALTLPIHQRQWSMLNEWYEKIVLLQTVEVALQLGINHGSNHHIVHDVLKYHKVCARGVPRQLTSELKVQHMNACKEHMEHCQTEGDVCLQCIVTGNESWAHFFQHETKRANQDWQHPNSPKPKKFCTQPSVGREMLHYSGTVRGRFWSITILGDHKHPSYCGLLVNH